MVRLLTNILLLEPDRDFARQLARALAQHGNFTVTTVTTVKEACLFLMRSPQDLAFIPAAEGAKIVRALRAVQPDLRLVAMTPTAEADIPQTYAGSVQGVLIKPLLKVELPVILEEVLAQPLLSARAGARRVEAELAQLDTAVLIAALNQARLGRLVQSVVFAHGMHMLAYWGELQEREAATIALYVGQDWLEQGSEMRMQFLHMPARAGDMLLYTHRVLDDYYLTLVARPETPLGELRTQAARMVVTLRKVVLGKTAPLQPLDASVQEVDGRISYALVWRPVRPLPQSLFIPLRRAITRLAAANACVITHALVQAEFVHIVVNCPPGRDSTWAAYLFKNGSEQTIQQQYGVAASLWEPGFYAVKATDPLSDAELNLFLEQSAPV